LNLGSGSAASSVFPRSRPNHENAQGIWVGPVVGKWDLEANMAAKREPSKKVIDKHAKFLAAWEAAGFPDKFEYDGTTLNNVRSTADWYREQLAKSRQGLGHPGKSVRWRDSLLPPTPLLRQPRRPPSIHRYRRDLASGESSYHVARKEEACNPSHCSAQPNRQKVHAYHSYTKPLDVQPWANPGSDVQDGSRDQEGS
jgi:hypothetical protein